MTQINASIPNLIGGVSQQPDLLLLPSHMRAQTNGFSAPATGLSKRPGTRHLGAVPISGDGFYQMLDYGSRGLFWLCIAPTGAVQAVNVNGSPVPIYDHLGNAANAQWVPYLAMGNPSRDLKAIKEGDTTFLLNTSVVAQKTAIGPQAPQTSALAWVKSGAYGRTYSIAVPGKGTAVWTTADGQAAWMSPLADTALIAKILYDQLVSFGVTCALNGSVIHILNAPSGITMEDGQGGSASAVIYRSVRSAAELPSQKVPHGFHVKVEGGDATGAGDYYLRFDSTTNIWREVADPTANTFKPDSSTMPIRLIPYGSGFMLSTLDFQAQLTGDSETNPGPSFYGKTINDIFFHQDRLGILSGEGFDFSESGTYYNFYRTTARDLLDSDPISGTVQSTAKLSILRHAVPFGERLFAFSETAQFEIKSDGPLTPKSVSAQRVTDFECSSAVRPVGLGSTLYFPVDRGPWTSMFNFYLDGIDNKAQAGDISGHVPKFIPKAVHQIAISPVNNLMVVLSRNDPQALYVYQFYINGSDRLQSAWHRWDFGAGVTIRGIGVIGTALYLLMERPTAPGQSTTYVESLEFTEDTGARLDRRIVVEPSAIHVSAPGVYPPTSTFTIPYAVDSASYNALVGREGGRLKPGTIKDVQATPGGTLMTIKGDLTGCTLEFGRGYRFAATLGCFFVREQAGAGSAGVTRGRTQVTRAWINYANAGVFDVEVRREGYPTVSYRCTTKNLGTLSATVGRDSTNGGRFAVPVMSRNTASQVTLINDSLNPSSFISIDWEGYHVARGQHV